MLAFLRKHQYGLMLFVAIIVIIAFTFFYNPNDRSSYGEQDAFWIDGEGYNANEVSRIGRQLELATTSLGYFDMVATNIELHKSSPASLFINKAHSSLTHCPVFCLTRVRENSLDDAGLFYPF